MLIVLDSLLIALFAAWTVALLRPPTRAAVILGWYVVAFASVVLSAEIASLLGRLSAPGIYLLVHALMAGGAGALWWRAGQPTIWGSLHGWWRGLNRATITGALRRDPVLWLLGAGVLAGYLVGLVVMSLVPPNTGDALVYMQARIGFWLQHDSLAAWNTPDLRQTTFPPNAELGMLWLMVFVGNGMFTRLVQWVAAPFLVITIAGLSRLAGHQPRQGVFVGLLVLTFPQVYLQTITVKNDLLLALFVGAGIYLLLVGLERADRRTLALSALAFALAAGTKFTLGMIMAGLVIWVLLLAVRYGREAVKLLAWWAAVGLAAFLVLSSYVLLQSWQEYDHPLGTAEFQERESTPPDVSRLKLLEINTARYIYQMLDVSGVPNRFAEPLHAAKVDATRTITARAGIDLQDSATARDGRERGIFRQPSLNISLAWYGPLGALLFISVLPQTVLALRRRNMLHIGAVLLAWSMLLTLSSTVLYSPYKGDYFILIVPVLAAWAAWLYLPGRAARDNAPGDRERALKQLGSGIIAGFALVILAVTVITSDDQPLVGPYAIWDMDRHARVGPKGLDARRQIAVIADQRLPNDAHVGLAYARGEVISTLFGEKFTRTLEYIYPYPERLDADWWAQQDYDYVIIGTDLLDYDLPPETDVIAAHSKYVIVRSAPAGAP